MANPFGYSGRIGRKTFALTSLCVVFTLPALMLLVWMHGFTVNPSDDGRWQEMPFYILALEIFLLALFLWLVTAATAKRLHDLNFSGFWQVALFALPALTTLFKGTEFLPYIGGLQSVIYAYLGLMPSKTGSNKYGFNK
jgi:uncharacterized membrane protein YhaH (DUF805 family)